VRRGADAVRYGLQGLIIIITTPIATQIAFDAPANGSAGLSGYSATPDTVCNQQRRNALCSYDAAASSNLAMLEHV
jgi:hypothetical protein